MTRARALVGATETTAALVHLRRPSKLSTLTRAGHAAVRRSGRPLRLQPQRRPARLPGPARDATGPRAGSTAAPTPRSAARWLEDAWDAGRAGRPPPRGAARPVRRPGQPGGARRRTATPYHYAGNTENPVFTFRLGRIGLASTGIYSLDRSLFRFVAPGATDRRLVRAGLDRRPRSRTERQARVA